MSNKKELIINGDDVKNKLVIETIKQFKQIQEQMEHYKKLDKVVRESLKKYDFEKITILDNNETIVFSSTQYEQKRKELNKDKLIDLLEGYIKGDLEMGDFVNEKQIPLTDDLNGILENSYELKIVKCVKYGVK